MSDSQLTTIPGIGPAAARILTENGFASVAALAKAADVDLAKIQGFGTVRAALVIAAAQSLVAADGVPMPTASPKKVEKAKKKKKKKKKKDKKGKGKKNDKKGKKKRQK